jgi:hypothetical protein
MRDQERSLCEVNSCEARTSRKAWSTQIDREKFRVVWNCHWRKLKKLEADDLRLMVFSKIL